MSLRPSLRDENLSATLGSFRSRNRIGDSSGEVRRNYRRPFIFLLNNTKLEIRMLEPGQTAPDFKSLAESALPKPAAEHRFRASQ